MTKIFVKTGHIIWASQVVLVAKKLLANAGDVRDRSSLGREDPPEESTATHPSILAWDFSSVLVLENPMGRGAWWAIVAEGRRVGQN